jgi:hypothetical protein
VHSAELRVMHLNTPHGIRELLSSLILIALSLLSITDFLLTDVGSVFVWTEGLYRHAAEQAFLLTEEMVVPYLVHRG